MYTIETPEFFGASHQLLQSSFTPPADFQHTTWSLQTLPYNYQPTKKLLFAAQH